MKKVLIIAGILLLVAAVAAAILVPKFLAEKERLLTQSNEARIETLESACGLYARHHQGKWPETWDELIQFDPAVWGPAKLYQCPFGGAYKLVEGLNELNVAEAMELYSEGDRDWGFMIYQEIPHNGKRLVTGYGHMLYKNEEEFEREMAQMKEYHQKKQEAKKE